MDLPIPLNLSHGGRPMPDRERRFFESRFDRDFSDVRIHEGHAAASMAGRIAAHAFTHRNHIVLGAGHSISRPGDRPLLAHELAHVIQQDAGGRRGSKSATLAMGRPSPVAFRVHACNPLIQRSANTCTYGEIRQWAVKSMSDHDPPAGLGDAKASIGAACTSRNCSCYSGAGATAPADQAAWRNIVAASGTDRSGGGRFMCVGSQNCWFVDQCYHCVDGNRRLTNRQAALVPVGRTTVTGKGTLYFYNVPHQGWCNREDWRSGCRS
jgi:hypothetical protein